MLFIRIRRSGKRLRDDAPAPHTLPPPLPQRHCQLDPICVRYGFPCANILLFFILILLCMNVRVLFFVSVSICSSMTFCIDIFLRVYPRTYYTFDNTLIEGSVCVPGMVRAVVKGSRERL